MGEGWNRRRRWNQLITDNQKKDLLSYIAGAGENYQSYEMFCDRMFIPKFTPQYLRTWIQRHRRTIQELRAEHIAAVASEARLGRKERIALLEDKVARIEQEIESLAEDITVDGLVKLIEMQRKLLDSIAIERGEKNKASEDDPAEQAKSIAQAQLANALAAALRSQQPVLAEPAIEAESRELTEEEAAQT